MSRLAERLMRMDEERPTGQGSIPGLAPPAGPRRKWRIVALLVILLGMSVVAAGLAVRLRGEAPPTPLAAPVPRPVAAPVASPRVAEPPADLGRAREAAAQGDLAEAARLFQQALAARPDDPEAWNDLGVVRVRQGDLGRGVEAFRQALDRRPGHAEARRNLAVALDRRGRHDEAAEHYRQFLRVAAAGHPAVADVRRRLEELGRPGERS